MRRGRPERQTQMSTNPAPSHSAWSCACRSFTSVEDHSDLLCGRCGQTLVAEAPIALVVDNDTRPSAPLRVNPPRAQQHGNLPAHIDLREVVYRWEYEVTTGTRAEAAHERGETYTRRLTGAQQKVAFNLLDHLRPGTWLACRSQEGIAEDLGLDVKTVRSAIDVLVAAGFILQVYRRPNRNGGRDFFEYRLNHHRLRTTPRPIERPRIHELPDGRRQRVRAEEPAAPPATDLPVAAPPTETPAGPRPAKRNRSKPQGARPSLPTVDQIASLHPDYTPCSICQGTGLEVVPDRGARPCAC